jgi:ATP-dependent RNA helicase DOB1
MENQASNIEMGSTEETEMTSQYYQMDQQLLLTKRKVSQIVQKPEYIVKFLQTAGRFLDISVEGENFGWGVLISCKKKADGGSSDSHILEVLLRCVDRHFDTVEGKVKEEDILNVGTLWRGSTRQCRPVRDKVNDEKLVSMRVFTVGLENIDRISAVRIFTPQSVRTPEARKKVDISIMEVQKRFPDGIPLLDPVKDLGIEDEAFKTLMVRASALAERLLQHKLFTDYSEDDRLRLVRAYESKLKLQESARRVREEARSCQTMTMKDDLRKMKRVLKKLGHVDANGVIQTKGRTACEINTANELVVVELIFAGFFKSMTVEQCVAVLSCMTFDEPMKDDDDPTKGLKSHLLNPFHKLQEVAKAVAQVQIACNVDIDEEEFVDKFNPGM